MFKWLYNFFKKEEQTFSSYLHQRVDNVIKEVEEHQQYLECRVNAAVNALNLIEQERAEMHNLRSKLG